ncbi:hypothetical protein HU200_051943 [Digitaria exilis]|uniref:Uncharacterized protein n=1 Tax=Digitaria exilis TaxID=1010633 RepID=A0A835AUL7_9POAL|nr:hypothetical protein HU200_051943 [Digitaria exilis]
MGRQRREQWPGVAKEEMDLRRKMGTLGTDVQTGNLASDNVFLLTVNQIARRRAAHLLKYPDTKIISLGIGDTTEPIPHVITNAMAEVPPCSYEMLCQLSVQKVRAAIAATYYADLGIEDSDIFVSDGAKCDISRLQVPKELTCSLKAYVDSSVIMGQTGLYQQDVQKYGNIEYMRCNPKNGFFPDLSTVALETASFSKYAGFTGVRLGWTVVPKELLFSDGHPVAKDFNRIVCTCFNGASNISQAGGLACLSPEGLKNAPYVWVHFPGRNSWDVFAEILEKANVVTTPGNSSWELLTMGVTRRFLNMIVSGSGSTPGVKTLRRIDLTRQQLFYPDTPRRSESGGLARPPSALEMETIRLSGHGFSFRASDSDPSSERKMSCFPLGDCKVICADDSGGFVFDLHRRKAGTMPHIRKPPNTTTMPISVFVLVPKPDVDDEMYSDGYGSSLFLMERFLQPEAGMQETETENDQFVGIINRRPATFRSNKSWHCHILPPPPLLRLHIRQWRRHILPRHGKPRME